MEAKGVALLQWLSGDGGLKEAALLRQGNAKVRGDEQKSSQANLVGTSPQHRIKSSIHYKTRCVYSAPTY
jgi:hypothetical protein